jgi:predicted HTH transcriptional regulator
MLFGGRRVADITEADIRGLLGTVAEGTGVDYKLAIGRNDEAKREFGADTTSFANTEGGYILVGLDEVDGIASEITGVDADDLDAEILRLENLARLLSRHG